MIKVVVFELLKIIKKDYILIHVYSLKKIREELNKWSIHSATSIFKKKKQEYMLEISDWIKTIILKSSSSIDNNTKLINALGL